ncbi:MAG: histidinol dehydrogenase [Planctomycetaceae bacterium]|nr:MAG: histidinol dehydrogenase [Planctomycetaceae bacterium]
MQIAVWNTQHDDVWARIRELRDRLSVRGDIVSESSRQRTVEIFGQELTPQQVVQTICRDVRSRGLAAVLEYTRKLDRRELTVDSLRVSDAELQAAHQQVPTSFLATIRRVRDNIAAFQSRLLTGDVRLVKQDGQARIELQQRFRPLRRVGLCVPGGAAAYPSTVMMTAVPAQVAGVRELAVVVPPTDFGGYNPYLLATCAELGLSEVYRIGGAQAVAALAYGIEGIPKVDKIVGPGNLFVALAKQYVFGEVDIDSIAGPSEVVVLADDSAHPDYLASDLISQAEHAPGCSVLITWHAPLISDVLRALTQQLASLERAELALQSLQQFGACVVARDAQEAVALTEALAPEHLHISTRYPEQLLEQLQNVGAIFLGHETPVAVGDYVAGPSHVLPTGGTARFASGLSAQDFLKRSSIIRYNQAALAQAAPDIETLAGVEGLTAHAASVRVRLHHAQRTGGC